MKANRSGAGDLAAAMLLLLSVAAGSAAAESGDGQPDDPFSLRVVVRPAAMLPALGVDEKAAMVPALREILGRLVGSARAFECRTHRLALGGMRPLAAVPPRCPDEAPFDLDSDGLLLCRAHGSLNHLRDDSRFEPAVDDESLWATACSVELVELQVAGSRRDLWSSLLHGTSPLLLRISMSGSGPEGALLRYAGLTVPLGTLLAQLPCTVELDAHSVAVSTASVPPSWRSTSEATAATALTTPPLVLVEASPDRATRSALAARVNRHWDLGPLPRRGSFTLWADRFALCLEFDSALGAVAARGTLSLAAATASLASSFGKVKPAQHALIALNRARMWLDGPKLMFEGQPPALAAGFLAPALRQSTAWIERPHLAPGSNPCRQSLRLIVRAAFSWGQELGIPAPSAPAELVRAGYLHRLPPCPARGTYRFDDGIATCSVHGH
ncbi:MAG: hypothetical protein HY815_23200 [Candidatus Riflebacteria bacterium]|nr:hypothetical protein [Candidatus Riflebacteria bacterium]